MGGQKETQKEWYNDNKARCSLDLKDLNNEVHLARFRSILPPGLRFDDSLEVGCGDGWYSAQLRPRIGVDISFNSVKRFEGLRTRLMVADVENLPFADSSFDVVYGFSILHHLENIGRGLKEINRVLKPGGCIAFGGENSALCPMNYVFPVLYGNWHIEKGFRRISPVKVGALLNETGFADHRYATGGFAIYGINEPVMRATRAVESVVERSAFLRRFAGFLYFSAKKSTPPRW